MNKNELHFCDGKIFSTEPQSSAVRARGLASFEAQGRVSNLLNLLFGGYPRYMSMISANNKFVSAHSTIAVAYYYMSLYAPPT